MNKESLPKLPDWEKALTWIESLPKERLPLQHIRVKALILSLSSKPNTSTREIEYLSNLKVLIRNRIQHPDKSLREVLAKLLTPNTNKEALHQISGNILHLLLPPNTKNR